MVRWYKSISYTYSLFFFCLKLTFKLDFSISDNHWLKKIQLNNWQTESIICGVWNSYNYKQLQEESV